MLPMTGPGRIRLIETMMSLKLRGRRRGSTCACARDFDLKHADGVGPADLRVDGFVIEGQPIDIWRVARRLLDDAQRFGNGGEHPQAEDVDFDQPGVFDASPYPTGRRSGPGIVAGSVGRRLDSGCSHQDHAAVVDAEMPGQAVDLDGTIRRAAARELPCLACADDFGKARKASRVSAR